VPIHGEKTDILFYPTPSVSYEPMFASLEKKAGAMCLGIFLAVIILGKIVRRFAEGIDSIGCMLGLWCLVVDEGSRAQWSGSGVE